MKKIMFLLLCGFAVSGCTTTRENYETGATALAGSKSLRNEVTQKCIAHARYSNPHARHNAALLMDVRDTEVDRLACSRMVSAIASGRLSYEEAMALHYGRLTPKIVKILQGR
jgi:hypothetical protein